MTRSPARLCGSFTTGLSMALPASLHASSGDAPCGRMFLPGGERAGLRRERIALDEFAAARLDLNLAVAPRHFAARQGETRQALHLDALEDVVIDRRELGLGGD